MHVIALCRPGLMVLLLKNERISLHIRARNSREDTMTLNITTSDDLNRIATHLYRLIDINPHQALREVRQFRGKGKLRLSARSIRAAVLIDSGGRCKDPIAVTEGIKILRRLVSVDPDNHGLRYNLANGLSQLAKLAPYSGPDGYLWRAQRSTLTLLRRGEFE